MVAQLCSRYFPGDPLLCSALTRDNFATKHREEWRGQLARRAYIVPNPMLAVEGLSQVQAARELIAEPLNPALQNPLERIQTANSQMR